MRRFRYLVVITTLFGKENMKTTLQFLLVFLACAVSGCLSMTAPQLGMTEKDWLRSTLIGDVAHIDGDFRVYRSNGAYYYFRQGKLVKVDEGQEIPKKIAIEISEG